jgi:hypothetical protein
VTTITVWADTGHTVANLSPADVVRHHRERNLMPADYLLVTSSTAIVLYEAGLLDVRLFGMLADDVQADVRRHMRHGVEARRRVGA